MPLTLEPLPAHDYAAWREEVVARRVAHPRLRGLGADTAAARAWAVVDRLLPVSGPPAGTEVLEVRADEESPRRVGTFFLLPAGPDRVELGDLVLDDPTDAAPLRHLLAERLAPRGIRTLGVGVLAGDPVHEAFAADPAAELTATQMQLDLASARPATATGAVRVEPMGAEALAAYLDGGVEEFAGDLLASDSSLSRERALERSREVHDDLLPQGLDTPGHDFLAALEPEDGRRVGFTWLFHEERAGFVYDVVVEEPERGRGLGRALMEHAADHLARAGMEVVGLNVFGHNHVARRLYDSLGYRVVDQSVTLPLEGLIPR